MGDVPAYRKIFLKEVKGRGSVALHPLTDSGTSMDVRNSVNEGYLKADGNVRVLGIPCGQRYVLTPQGESVASS